MKNLLKLLIVLVMGSSLGFVWSGSIGAGENLIQNSWAQGLDNANGCWRGGDIHSGWNHSETVSLSRCPKNPPPPGSVYGSAFKNGPRSGPGMMGVETLSRQNIFHDVEGGFWLEFSTLLICVRCDYFIAEIQGDGVVLGEILHFNQGMTPCDTSEKWNRYCGSLYVPPGNYGTIKLRIRTMFTLGNSLGVKWTGLELYKVD